MNGSASRSASERMAGRGGSLRAPPCLSGGARRGGKLMVKVRVPGILPGE